MIEHENTIIERQRTTANLIRLAAMHRCLPMSTERVNELTAYTGYLKETNRQNQELGLGTHAYNRGGLKLREPLLMGFGGKKPRSTCIVDFIPAINEDDDPAYAHPQRRKTSEITMLGLHMLQDFIVLADAGLTERPEAFFGKTNDTMARFARRAGFEPTPKNDGGIYATYDTVAAHIFSSETVRIEKLLELRLGNAALTA